MFTESPSSSAREPQQDARESNQAELPEVDPEENSAEFMGILIKVGARAQRSPRCCVDVTLMCAVVLFPQALAKLKKIPETIKAIMERLEPELKQIVKRSTTQIADHAYQRGESLAQESQPRYGIPRDDRHVDQLRKSRDNPAKGLLGFRWQFLPKHALLRVPSRT